MTINTKEVPTMKRMRLWIAVTGIVALAAQGFGQDKELEFRKNASLFNEYHKNGDYQSAIPYGWKVIELDPARNKPIYHRMAECYFSFYEKATDPALKTAYVDTMLHLYDLGIKHIADRAGALWLQKAYALENYYPDKEQEAIAAYEKTLEIDFDGTDFAYIDRLGALYIKNIPNDASSKMKAVELYRRVAEKDPTNQTVVDRLRRLITDPRELIELAEKKLATDPENMEYLWSTAQSYIQAEQFDGAERHLGKLVKKAPTTVNYWNELGKVYFRDRKFRQSIDAYESALKLNPAVKENYLNIAWCHRELKNFESARTYAQRAAQRERGWGRPYMEIAEIYKAAVEDCIMNSKEGDWAKMDLNDKLVYKLAHESYQRAKSVEPGIASEADQRARELSTLVPSREDYFFHRDKIKDGKLDIQGSCYTWIKETATVPR